MHRWFEPVIRPVLDHAAAATVVHVAGPADELDELLLTWASAADATVHTVRQADAPITSGSGDHQVVHVGAPTPTLAALEVGDVVILGDTPSPELTAELLELLLRRQPTTPSAILVDGRGGGIEAVRDVVGRDGVPERRVEIIPSLGGLAVVWDPASSPRALADFLGAVRPSAPVGEILAVVDAARDQAVADLASERERYADTQEQLTAAQQRMMEAERDRAERELELQLLRRRAEAAEAGLSQLQGRRIVRLGLQFAELLRPAFAAVRRLRSARSSRPRPTLSAPRQQPAAVATAPEARADIVLCVHNAPDDVQRCLDSLRRNTDLDRHQLIIVDDGSDTETADLLDRFVEEQPDVRLLRNPEARGYTRAANQGAAAGISPYFVLLNSDTIVSEGWIESLLRCAVTMPDAAIVGPLSNAASWQSVPETTDDDGGWVVNELPDGMTVDDVATALARRGTQLYPEVPLVNGFCYLVRRDIARQLDGLDEETFPTGYGEEDDFTLRARAAGHRAYIADDAYVYHAKSKSFTPEGRLRHVEENRGKLYEKHSKEAVARAVSEIRSQEDLLRARTAATLAMTRRDTHAPEGLEGLRVGWVQPHLLQVGGIRRAIEMTNLLKRWGAEPTLITPGGETADWLPMRSRAASRAEAARETYDILLVSDPDTVEWASEIRARELIVFHLAAYSIYRPLEAELTAFHRLEGTHIANSTWTAEHIADLIPGAVEAIVPGAVDARLFRPVRAPVTHDVVCYGSSRRHKGTATIEAAARRHTLLKLADLDLAQAELPRGICSGRVFASGAWHEGFNLPPLEAMACGIPVALTDDGGSREYAVDGENALVVPVRDADALEEAIDRLLEDQQLRQQFIVEGMRTAAAYTWEAATARLAEVLTGH